MIDANPIVRVGQEVPDFEIDIYDPTKDGFSRISLSALKSQQRWTILFFYPGDFTFV